MVAALFVLALFQDSARDVLKPGKAEGVMKENSPLLKTLNLESRGVPAGSVKAESFSVRIPSAGSWTLEMKSYSFDSYLVLRDSSGKVLAENDDGPVGLHARLVFQANQDSQLQVDAGCIWEGAGPFTLELRQGKPADLNPVALAEARIVDGEAWISYQREIQGPWIALAMEQTGRFCREAGRLGKAESMAREALLLWEKKLGSEHPKIGEAWLDLGKVLIDQGRGEPARQAFEEALERYEAHRPSGSNDLLSIQGMLAESYITMGKYIQAERLLRPALEQAFLATDANLFLVPGLQDALGRVLQHGGAIHEARSFLEAALEAREYFSDTDPIPWLWSLNNLGFLEQEMFHLTKARMLYEEALSSAGLLLGPEHELTLQVRMNLAAIMRQEGDLNAAEKELAEIYRLSRSVRGGSHPRTLEIQLSLAVLRSLLGRGEEARENLESLILVLKRNPHVHPKRLIAAQSNLALNLAGTGDAQAGLLFKEILEYSREKLGESHPQTAFAQLRFARYCIGQGALKEAVTWAGEAEKSLEMVFGPGHPYGVMAQRILARANLLQGDLSQAWEFAKKSVRTASDYLVRLYLHLPEPARVRVARGFHSSLHLLLSLARLDPEKQGEAFTTLLDSRGRIQRTFSGWDSIGEDDDGLTRELIRIQGEISAAVLGGVDRNLAGEKEALAKLHQERMRLERELLRIRPASPFSSELTSSAFSGSLPPDSSLIIFSVHPVLDAKGWHPARVEAWVLVGEGEPVLIDLGPATPLRKLISDMTGAHTDRGAEAIEGLGRNLAQEIYSAIWSPLEELLGESELVFLSPDSFLGSLPFDVLQNQEGRFLLEDYKFVYLPNPTSLFDLPQKEPSGESLLSVGGVIYKTDSPAGDGGQQRGGLLRRDTWDFLNASTPEAKAVNTFHSNRFPGAQQIFLKGLEADEATVKSEMQRASFLHLATHALAEVPLLTKFANPLWKMGGDEVAEALLEEKHRTVTSLPGLLSFLVLSGASDSMSNDANDGYLTAEEVAFLNLSGCRMVVLSACMAALGASQAEEGMTSLQRSFLRAGARRVISTLWKVDDAPAKELMVDFYEYLWILKMSPFDALTAARREMLRSQRSDPKKPINPRTWGAYIFSGDWR